MTDLSKQLLEKAHGGPKLNPDEQRRYLGTFEERVLGYADIDTANSPQLEKGFLSILENLFVGKLPSSVEQALWVIKVRSREL